ncbi:MAG: dephospho-CoA kinase [Bacteroidetes bacterium]|nr:dephospho-CoA kinase [Bacteroidota bacterium]
MIKVGITGGIGSGKTTVCKLFELLGVPVYYSDTEAKKLLDEDEVVKQQIVDLFGHDVIDESGKVDRKKMAALVFNNKERLEQLNAVVHPAVAQHFEAWCKKQTNVFILKEAAILFESGAHKQVDKVIVVSAPLDLKVERVIKRDKVAKEEVLKRINNQMPDEEKVKLADHVIYNNEKELLIPQVIAVYQQLIN